MPVTLKTYQAGILPATLILRIKSFVGQALCTGLPPLRVGAIDCPHTREGHPPSTAARKISDTFG